MGVSVGVGVGVGEGDNVGEDTAVVNFCVTVGELVEIFP